MKRKEKTPTTPEQYPKDSFWFGLTPEQEELEYSKQFHTGWNPFTMIM